MSDEIEVSPYDLRRLEISSAQVPILNDIPKMTSPSLACSPVEEYKQEVDELEHHITYPDARSNTAAPIQRLPVELLMRIFGTPCLTNCDIGVAHVCRRWRSVLFNTSQFWANVIANICVCEDCEWHMQLLETALAHSGALLLSMRFLYPSDLSWATITDHQGRIFELQLLLSHPREAQGVETAVRLRLPRLAQMWLSYDEHPSEFPPLYFRDEDLPSLLSMCADGFPIQPSMIVSSIESLKLQNTHMQLEALTDVLARCQKLKSLTLFRTLSEDEHTEDVSHRRVRLPHLRELTIEEGDEDAPRLLAIFTPIPEEVLVHLKLGYYSRTPEIMYSQFPGISGPPLIDLLCAEYVRREPWSPIVAKGFVGGRERLRLSFNLHGNRDLLDILRPLAKSRFKTLVINLQTVPPGLVIDKFSRAVPQLFPHCRRLFVSHCTARPVKREVTEQFLKQYSHVKKELTVSWEILFERNEADPEEAVADLNDLLGVLQRCQQSVGKARLGTLELRGVECQPGWTAYTGYADGSQRVTTRCRRVAEPFMSRLERFVDVVVIT